MKKIKNGFKQLATKKDLKSLELSTKKDMKSLELSTKKDFKRVDLSLKKLNSDLKDLEYQLGRRIDGLKDYMDYAFGELREEMYTKADHSKFMILIDETITELRDAREGRVSSEAHIMRLDDHVINHEKRLIVLENK